ncbi:MAG: hypothetical protein Q7U33_05210 [Methylotenera sp.]|uniref:hypothetical protein n=1 Tax=Methylotenera sp. TaxID=2051956 RepID=UPI00271D946A|nr:hypothetical protein [Methylotenera sp.]MDO9150761.1 hypothetical protein [Methylotenera sp.]
MTKSNIYVLLICLSLLNACADKHLLSSKSGVKQDETINITQQDEVQRENVVTLIQFYDSYTSLTADDQKSIYADTNEALIENKSDSFQRIKLAMMLSLPSSRMRDINKAQLLLQNILQENNLHSTEYALVNLLYEYTLDSTKQMQKNRDEAKKLETAQTKYDNLQQKYDTLEQKLNDLKNIEKTMNERDVKPANKP